MAFPGISAIAGITHLCLRRLRSTRSELLCIIICVLRCEDICKFVHAQKLLSPDARLISIFPNVIKLSPKVTCRSVYYIRSRRNGFHIYIETANRNRALIARGNFRKTFESANESRDGNSVASPLYRSFISLFSYTIRVIEKEFFLLSYYKLSFLREKLTLIPRCSLLKYLIKL